VTPGPRNPGLVLINRQKDKKQNYMTIPDLTIKGANMKRNIILLSIVIAVVLLFVVSAQAIFCNKCGTDNPDGSKFCSNCGNKLQQLEKSLYETCCDLYSQEEYDQVISLLSPYCVSNPKDKSSELLLAKAYLEKCNLLKQEGSAVYEALVLRPYEIGKRIHLARDQHLPEALYVCGRSFYINNRRIRSMKYLKKAIKLSSSPPAEYFIALGDAQFDEGKREDPAGMESTYYLAALNTYSKVIEKTYSNNDKGKAYYKIGVFRLYLNEKKHARQAFESALQLAETNSLISRIRNKMESLEH
jgi:tetratricopeptide (TPR) repeat protein